MAGTGLFCGQLVLVLGLIVYGVSMGLFHTVLSAVLFLPRLLVLSPSTCGAVAHAELGCHYHSLMPF